MASREDKKEIAEFSADDLAKIFHYPSIGQLFSDPASAAIGEFKSRMISTRDDLEKIVRRGNREDADKAGIAIRGVNVTLDFLSSLQDMRLAEK